MVKHSLLKILFSLLFTSQIISQQISNENLISIKSYSSLDKVVAGSELLLAVEVEIAEIWHINSNSPKDEFLVPTSLSVSGNNFIEWIKVAYPPAKEYKFDFSDNPVLVWEGKFLIPFKVKFSENIETRIHPIIITIEYQACNNSACLAPNSVSDTLQLEFVDNKAAINQINQNIFDKIDLNQFSDSLSAEEDDSLANQLEKSGLLLSLILVFLGGLALNLTPCVYPLIPITIGYFGGQSEGKTSKLFVMGLLFVLGMAVTYSIIGVVTSLTGAVFGALLQNPIVILVIVSIFIALSLSMFGVYEFKLPDGIVAKASATKTGLYGSFFMGLTMGIVAAPCIGPFVLGLVTYVATKGDPFFGFLMFFILALGLGFPYLILAIFSGKIKSLPRAGLWMEAVKHIFGLILLAMAIYFALPLIPKLIAGYILPIYGLLAAVYLLLFVKAANSLKGFKIFKLVFSILIIVVSIYNLIPSDKQSIAWINYKESELANALEKKGVIIDFYADWCIPCKELDALTFSDPEVIKISENFINLKADMTKSLSPEVEELRQKYRIVGVPTVLILNSRLEEIHRITGFMNATEFKKLLEDERLNK
jgi:thiol:disulfide interchange protein DsbD